WTPAEGFAPGARSNVGGTVKRVLVHFSYFAQNDAKKELRKLATKIAELVRRYRGRRLATFAAPSAAPQAAQQVQGLAPFLLGISRKCTCGQAPGSTRRPICLEPGIFVEVATDDRIGDGVGMEDHANRVVQSTDCACLDEREPAWRTLDVRAPFAFGRLDGGRCIIGLANVDPCHLRQPCGVGCTVDERRRRFTAF